MMTLGVIEFESKAWPVSTKVRAQFSFPLRSNEADLIHYVTTIDRRGSFTLDCKLAMIGDAFSVTVQDIRDPLPR